MSDLEDEILGTDPTDQDIVKQAMIRFHRCEEWESTARERFIDDIKFVNGDSYNQFQWPSQALNLRGFGTNDEKPTLTINKAAQHCLQVINDGKQNKSSISIKPVGDGATYEAAQVMEGIVRHIEYISDAQAAYEHASTYQVQGGIGFVRVITDYIDNDSWDQEIFIRPVKDPLSVYMDPDASQADGSDMRFCFLFEDLPKDEFKIRYPDITVESAKMGDMGWISKDHVRVAEYYYKTEIKDKLYLFTDPNTGEQTKLKLSETKGFSGDLKKALAERIADPYTKERDIIRNEIRHVIIAGDTIVEHKTWAGDTIPIAFALGIQTIIDGELDRKGHVRALIDAQRMLNYNASASIEYGALQTKTPYLASVASIEGYETYWSEANRENFNYLPFNHRDDEGNPLEAPSRIPPPMTSQLYQEGMQMALMQMMDASGQYQSTFGQKSNEISGKAIQQRQRAGENATYHFINNQARMMRRIGKIIIDLIPKIYDTPRIIKILGEDGTDSDVQLDPQAEAAYEKKVGETEEEAAKIILNPSIGKYDVQSDIGPDYATRRQEEYNALTQIAVQAPELMQVIGDLIMKAADFPGAEVAAERLERMVPAQAKGGPDPQVQQLQKELATTQGLMASMTVKLQELQSKAATHDEQKEIDVYKAITDRLDILMKYTHVPEGEILQMQHELAINEHQGNLDLASKIIDSNLQSDQDDTEQ